MKINNNFLENSATGMNQVANIVDTLLIEAVRQKASDIHLEPLGDKTRVRLRVDGLLRTVAVLSLA